MSCGKQGSRVCRVQEYMQSKGDGEYAGQPRWIAMDLEMTVDQFWQAVAALREVSDPSVSNFTQVRQSDASPNMVDAPQGQDEPDLVQSRRVGHSRIFSAVGRFS